MGLFGGGSSTKPILLTVPGGFDDPQAAKAAEFASQISGLTDTRVSTPGVNIGQPATERPFFDQFSQELQSPQLGARTQNEQSIIQQLVSQVNNQNTQAGFNAPASSGTVAQAIAPQLFDFRQRELDNIRGGEQTFGGTELTERGQDITAASQGGQLDLNNFNSIIASLTGLTEFASPQNFLGTETKTEGAGILDSLINVAGIASGAGAFSGLGGSLFGGGGARAGGSTNPFTQIFGS